VIQFAGAEKDNSPDKKSEEPEFLQQLYAITCQTNGKEQEAAHLIEIAYF
jgi:hypothetical protein